MSNLTSLQSVSEAQNFTRSATLPRKARSTSTKPMKTAFPRAGPWLYPEARMKSTPSETMVKGACWGSMTFGWASTTWSQKASLLTSMGLPSPSSTGTRHSLTVASGKIVPSSPRQLRASGVTRPVTAARGTYASSPSPNSPFSGASSQKDRSWFTGWWFSRMVQNRHRGVMSLGIRETAKLATTFYCDFCPPRGLGDRKIIIPSCTHCSSSFCKNGLLDLPHSWSLFLV